MLDGPLTQSVLYEEILAALPARYVHLLVDACYAEAVVRPRDLQAQVVEVGDTELQSYASRATLARFPHVGALIATSSAARTHEWDVYRQGVFSHELLSGLRGAADVNRDGRVEYSEISAFLAAANREVADERAHLAVLARPPMVNRRSPLVDFAELRDSGRLVGTTASLGWFVVEDGRGNRLADVRAEPGFNLSLAVPADETLWVRSRHNEAHVRVASGGTVELASLEMRPMATTERGAIESALSRGLFAAAFGPAYDSGFVDGKSEFRRCLWQPREWIRRPRRHDRATGPRGRSSVSRQGWAPLPSCLARWLGKHSPTSTPPHCSGPPTTHATGSTRFSRSPLAARWRAACSSSVAPGCGRMPIARRRRRRDEPGGLDALLRRGGRLRGERTGVHRQRRLRARPHVRVWRVWGVRQAGPGAVRERDGRTSSIRSLRARAAAPRLLAVVR